MEELLDWLRSGSIRFGTDLVVAILILVFGLKLSKWLAEKVVSNPLFNRIEPNVRSFLSNTLLLVLRIGVIVATAYRLGVPGTAFVTLFGSVGVALGLAMQGSLSNLAGGLMLLLYRPFVVGDYIIVGESEGTVKQISAFYTTVVTVDNRTVLLPNGTLTNSTMVQCSAEKTRMIEIPCSVAYPSDAERVRAILLETALADGRVLREPKPLAPMTAMKDSAVTFTLRVWVKGADYLSAKWDLTESAKKALDEAGIEIPYPQMDVHLK